MVTSRVSKFTRTSALHIPASWGCKRQEKEAPQRRAGLRSPARPGLGARETALPPSSVPVGETDIGPRSDRSWAKCGMLEHAGGIADREIAQLTGG